MQVLLILCALYDGYPGAAFECTHQLIEPAHLASGEPPRPGSYEVLCLLQRERSERCLESSRTPTESMAWGLCSFPPRHVFESLGFVQAVQVILLDLRRWRLDCVPLWTK